MRAETQAPGERRQRNEEEEEKDEEEEEEVDEEKDQEEEEEAAGGSGTCWPDTGQASTSAGDGMFATRQPRRHPSRSPRLPEAKGRARGYRATTAVWEKARPKETRRTGQKSHQRAKCHPAALQVAPPHPLLGSTA